MGLILAGVAVCILLVISTIKIASSKKICPATAGLLSVAIAFGLTLGLFLISAGLVAPISGYEELQLVSTTKLVSVRDSTISEDTGNMFNVFVSGSSYTYFVEVDPLYTSDSQKVYKCETIVDKNVIIVEDDSYTEAKLNTYVRYGRKSFWTFAVGAKQYEYVFYVPTGTITRNISLG